MGVKIMSKSDFAAVCNVAPSCVSNWIARGKIKPDALVGEGRGAKIIVDVATKQLQESLDPNQRFGLNGISTRLDLAAPSLPASKPAPEADIAPSTPPTPTEPSVEDQIKREKLRQAQLATSRAEEQDRLSRGVYINAVAAREEMARIPRRIVDAFDGAIPEFAAAIAAKWQIPARDATHLLHAEFRRTRTRMAQEFAALAAEELEIIEDDLGDDKTDDHFGRKN
ncbi:hypothetical protein C5688_09155 [Methylocystis sp. MitZ-2018]|nr:hypothetical protein C5688_09155 [Methylocystis sp. MitZ-2018]